MTVAVNNPGSEGGQLINAFRYWLLRADFTGDGRSDIPWRRTTGGDVWFWHMAGTTVTAQAE